MNTRVERVKAMLREQIEVCSLTFYRTLHPNDRNAISEIKAEGWLIETELGRFDCGDVPVHAHHRLVRDPQQLRLAGVS